MHCSICGLDERVHSPWNDVEPDAEPSPNPIIEALGDNHYYEPCSGNGEERVDLGCVGCEREHPDYFAEVAYYKSLYGRAVGPTADDRELARANHERGHPERPLIGLTERILGTEAHS